jgi:NAD(P)H dehydrogenase (quinone)
MSLVIAGASGQFGRSAAESLLTRVSPSDVVLVTRKPESLSELAERGADVRHGDFDDPASLSTAFAGGERLLLISTDAVGRRVAQHAAAIDAAKAAGIGFVAYTSFLNAVAENPAGVVAEHRGTEAHLTESGLAYALLRNGMYADLQVADAQAAVATGKLFHNLGEGRTAYISRNDLSAAAAAVLAGGDHDGRIYELTGPELVGAADLARIYGELGGRAVEPVELSDDEMSAGLVEAGVPADYAPLYASFGTAIRGGFIDQRTGTVEALTGQRPRTLDEVLAAHRDELRAAVAA